MCPFWEEKTHTLYKQDNSVIQCCSCHLRNIPQITVLFIKNCKQFFHALTKTVVLWKQLLQQLDCCNSLLWHQWKNDYSAASDQNSAARTLTLVNIKTLHQPCLPYIGYILLSRQICNLFITKSWKAYLKLYLLLPYVPSPSLGS